MAEGLLLIVVFFFLVALNVPIAVSIGLSTLAALLVTMPFDPAVTTLAQRTAAGLDSFTLLAIPFFVLSGYLMGRGGIAKRLIEAAKAMVSALPGGLAVVNVVSCMLFGAVSGSAVAATSAIGSFMVPTMEKENYPRPFSAAVTVAGSILGLIIPPSNVLIVYAVAAGGVSIAALFMAGYLPGLIAGLLIIVFAVSYAMRNRFASSDRIPLRAAVPAMIDAIPSLAMVIVVVGGIVFGFFTATEASAIAVLYALILSVGFYRELKLSDLPSVLLKSIETTGIVLLLIGVSTGMAWVLAYGGLPEAISEALLSVSDNPIVILLLINLILLVVGAFLDITPAILIFTPIFLPVALELGMSPVHFGMMLVFNLSIGLCTPPVGTVLFVGAAVAGTTIAKMMRPLIVLYLALLIALMIVTYVPFVSEALPRAMGLMG